MKTNMREADLKHMSPAVRERNKDLLEPSIATAIKRNRKTDENDLQSEIITFAESRGWLCYHTFDSRRSVAGFPDLILLRNHRMVVAELKSDSGTVSEDQDRWLRAFVDTGAQVYEWRDRDWPEIERVLA